MSGAALGAACAALGVSVVAQLLRTAVLAATAPGIAVASFVPVSGTVASDAAKPSVAQGWRERRTFLIGSKVTAGRLAGP